MLRVIAGSARGRRLTCPAGGGTRPPTDLLKGAIFNILGRRVAGAKVLDVFAGSGAFGIEALSRGAATCLFLDQAREAVRVLTENLAHVGFSDRAEVYCAGAEKVGSLEHRGERSFDLVFLDPPFAMAREEGSLRMLERTAAAALALLTPGGSLVLRLPRKCRPPPSLPEPRDRRIYGDSEVWLYLDVERRPEGG